jgi:hypothetical protein
MLMKEAELTLNAVERVAADQTVEAVELIHSIWSNGFQVMKSAADTQKNSDKQAMHELKDFLDSAVAAEAVLKPPVLLPLKTTFKSFLRRPHVPVPSARDKSFCQGLRDLLEVLQRLAPDGRILLSGLAYLLHQSASAGKHLPPDWSQLDKEQVEAVLRGHLNGHNLVDWRAFLVGLMELPVASQRQLVMAANRLKEGSKAAFCNSKLWFDTAFVDKEEALEVKQLFYDTYFERDQGKANSLEFLAAAAHDTEPMAAFMKCCAFHQGQILEKESRKLGEMPMSEYIVLEFAIAACQSVMPTPDEAVGPRLQQIWNEVEELGLSDEERRARNRAVAAGTYVAVDVTLAAVNLLKDYDPMIELAREYFGKQKLVDLLNGIIHSQ